jgi:hypothetical protein
MKQQFKEFGQTQLNVIKRHTALLIASTRKESSSGNSLKLFETQHLFLRLFMLLFFCLCGRREHRPSHFNLRSRLYSNLF